MACSDKNSLRREGTAQHERPLEALSPTFAQVDERNLAQLLIFIRNYAAHLTYIDKENKPLGTWEPLVQRDLSVILATLASLDPVVFTTYSKSLVKRLRVAVRASAKDEAKRCFKFLFDLVYTLAKTVDTQCGLMDSDLDYQREIQDIIASRIDKPVRALLTFRAANSSLLPTSIVTDPLAPLATLNSSLATYKFGYISDVPEETLLNLSVPDVDELMKINFITHHNLFQQQVSAVLTATALAIRKAGILFASSLENYDKHQPHIALLQTFLKLFGHAQYELNQYGKKHLEYYYHDVLQLKQRRPEPDSAHLIIGLHKQVGSHLLKTGTLFKGGKNSDGKPLTYRLSKDVLLNQASVGKIHSLYKDKGRLYVTEDSNQEPVFLFGDATVPTPSTGFAIASKLLLLKGGERTITVSIRLNKALSRNTKTGSSNITLKTELTGEKGWLENRVNATYRPKDDILRFSIALDGGKGVIQHYDEKIHQRSIHTTLPLLMVYFDQEASGMSYDSLAALTIDEIQLSVDVQGYKYATLSNDIGLLDGSKPFKPFGDLPNRGAGFYIGSDELFQKPLTSLALATDLPALFSADYLFRGRWHRLPVVAGDTHYTMDIPGHPIQEAATTGGTGHGYGAGNRDGYIRLSLNSNRYSLSSFMDSLTQSFNETKLMKILPQATTIVRSLLKSDADEAEVKEISAKKLEVADTRSEMLESVISATQFEGFKMVRSSTPTPPELVVDKFEINYSAAETVTFGQPDHHAFFHLHPFGYKQIDDNKGIHVLPTISNNGEFFIGLAGIQSPNTVSLLVDVVEGSSNPLKPVETVYWYYLDSDNNWVLFEKGMLVDGTKHLSRTGIVTLSIPADATLNGTLMPAGIIWIKTAVQGEIDAICQLTAIRAQAAHVELVQEGEKGNYFKDVRPKGTISKLVVSDGAIKQIEQPSDSFGGRPLESADQFYSRTSELLRHKQRAITMWDYEHLVLAQFPSIYKVKCINRAGFIEDRGSTVFCENYPGHITIVTIPDLSKSSHANPLRPYTPIGTLVAIAEYLENLKNPFTTLHVRNPQFEEIQLEFNVAFMPGKDEAYHLTLLNDDIERFLCPWAFDTSASVSFGGKVHKSTLINFIEERPYVDVLSAFKMHHIIRDEHTAIKAANYDIDEVTATSSRSILVSYADERSRHLIRVTSKCECV